MSEDPTGSGADTLGGSTGAPAAGGAGGAAVAGGAGTATRSPNGGASRLGRLVSGLPLPVHDHETPATGGALDAYLPVGTSIPPPTHLTSADGSVALLEAPPGTFDLAAAPAVDLTAYYTKGEADAAFLTGAEGDLAYAALDHSHPSQQSAPWRFQNVATVADPGGGNFRSNTGVLATATRLVLSRMTQDGYDTPATGYGVVGGDTIYIQDRDDNTRWVRFLVLEPLSRFTTYVTSLVTVIGSAGTITDSQICQLTFTLAGGGGGGATAAYTKAESDARYEPLDSAYTKAEADARYTQGGLTQAAGDARYLPLTGGTLAGSLLVGTGNAYDLAATGARLRKVWTTDLDASGTVTFAGAPTAGGSALQTQTAADARYLQLSGGAVTGAVSGVWNTGGAPSGAPKLTVQSSAPSSPATGDLWVW